MTETDQALVDQLRAFAAENPSSAASEDLTQRAAAIVNIAAEYYANTSDRTLRREFVTAFDEAARALKRAQKALA